MPQEAQKLSVEVTADTTGLDDFFSCHDKAEQKDLTLEEAAKRLNLSERTVQRRLKNGQLKGYKIAGPRGPEWRIKVESCEDTTGQAFAASDDTTFSTDDTTIIETVSTEDTTRDSKATTTNAFTQFAEFYHEQIETLQEKLEAATFRNGYLEAQLSNAESQLKLLPDLSAKATKAESLEEQVARLESELFVLKENWFTRFYRWFLGRQKG